MKIKKMVKVETEVPDGTYSGIWSGYIVEFEYNGEKYEAEVEKGVRGLGIPCTITITGDEIEVN